MAKGGFWWNSGISGQFLAGSKLESSFEVDPLWRTVNKENTSVIICRFPNWDCSIIECHNHSLFVQKKCNFSRAAEITRSLYYWPACTSFLSKTLFFLTIFCSIDAHIIQWFFFRSEITRSLLYWPVCTYFSPYFFSDHISQWKTFCNTWNFPNRNNWWHQTLIKKCNFQTETKANINKPLETKIGKDLIEQNHEVLCTNCQIFGLFYSQ